MLVGTIVFSKSPKLYYLYGEKPIGKKQVVSQPVVASVLPAAEERKASDLEEKLMNMQATCEVGRIGNLPN